MRCVLVSHFHWDREWYRTFEEYRARLVDAMDRVLALLDGDPDFRFLLDGQTVLLDDYLEIRPDRRAALARGIREGRLGIGPWYVQPDSLLPSGEAHVRNLLHGRAAASAFGRGSRVAYVPDSFGHPAQLPQLFRGFDIDRFVHWRGSGDEVDRFHTRYRWVAPDGSAVAATLLREGYFNAACLPADPAEAARRLADAAQRLDDGSGAAVLLLNGFDHMPPDAHVGAVAAALARLDGVTSVERALLDDALPPAGAAPALVRGDLIGARLANLLPGVWSTRVDVKLRARRCEALLEAWVEPFAALGARLGAADERPAATLAWRGLLQSQAHDSLCGCSTDAVMRQVTARLAGVESLARETAARLLGRLGGLDEDRRTPWTAQQEVVVWNPSPHPRTDVVRVPLDPYPALRLSLGVPEIPPLLLHLADSPGVSVEGRPARVVAASDPERPRWLPGAPAWDAELVVAGVPAFGCRRLRLAPAPPTPDVIDDGDTIEAPGVRLRGAADGTLDLVLDGVRFTGLFAVEDRGDRGDTYDFDPVDGDPGAVLLACVRRRWRHPSGLQGLSVARTLAVPRGLDGDRRRRASDTVPLRLVLEARVAPGVARVDVTVRVDNPAADHRLRLLFPTGRPLSAFRAATTFDVARRTPSRPGDAGWVHPAPATFPHQGWIAANGLTVVAAGLPEAEVTSDGVIALTLLRAVGWLARFDLRSRPLPAGPAMSVAGAQCMGTLEARVALLGDCQPAAARDAELGLWGALGGPTPAVADGAALLALEPRDLVLSACKPAASGDGFVVRVLNPGDVARRATVTLGVPVRGARAVRLDEEPAEHAVTLSGRVLRFDVPARALRSVLLS